MKNSNFSKINWGESISERTHQALRELGWADPNDINDLKGQIKPSRAIMIVNFGPEGKTRPGLVADNDSLDQMISKVFTFYEYKLQNKIS